MAKLGSDKRPAVVNVHSVEKMEEIISLCGSKGWKVIVGIEPGRPENTEDVENLLNPPVPMTSEVKVGRNDPCPCGSGKKYKKCCIGKVNDYHVVE